MTNNGHARLAERSETISEFCAVENISISTYHKLKRLGLGPEELHILPKVIRITPEAHRDWRVQMKERAQTVAAALERERRREQTREAGELAAASPLHVSKIGRHRGGAVSE